MSLHRKLFLIVCGSALASLLLSSFSMRTVSERSGGDPAYPEKGRLHFPYRQAGLTDREAAAHLIGRFTFGATPGQVDKVCKMGLERWFTQQLEANQSEDTLGILLSGYDALGMDNETILRTFPRNGEIARMAKKDGVIPSDSAALADPKSYKDILKSYMNERGMKPQQELYRQFYNQKILRAAYANNQLLEVMTDFWFNHFNVSITKGDCAEFIPAYERDVIRPNALGRFGDLLLATAKSPAMLFYLDNFSSSAEVDGPRARGGGDTLQPPKRTGGINENYAREVMELHTLGVDGGYSQQDVTQAARVLTGWTVYPIGPRKEDNPLARRLESMGPVELNRRGFVHDGDFLFNPNRHDKGQKTVLGKAFGPDETNRPSDAYGEGVDLLDMLARHPSTAKFICKKIAIRFVCDTPPQSLVDRMAKTFRDRNGDIRQVLITMVSSPEFWGKDAIREKIKSPFELAISSVRSLQATIGQPFQLYNWVSRMGEKLYAYQAPTGYPDKGQYWINTGSLLNRMNFGLAFASGKIPGIRVDLAGLNDHKEPESAQAALLTYAKIILPERNIDATVRRLTPMLTDPSLGDNVAQASSHAPAAGEETVSPSEASMASGEFKPAPITNAGSNSNQQVKGIAAPPGDNGMLSQVVGIILGSPEFQRR